MTEWGVFGVIVAVISFGVLVGTPLIRLNSNITRLTVILEVLQKQVRTEHDSNEKEHTAIWDECEKHGDSIADHETRITVLEEGKRIIHAEGK
jgi:hypothetical protein